MESWSPSEYMRFGDERTRPPVDLASRIALERPAAVIDLGCGPGNSTRVLRQRWPDAHVIGLDSSSQMIGAAREDEPHLWMHYLAARGQYLPRPDNRRIEQNARRTEANG